MANPLRDIFKHSSIYGLGQILSRLASLLLLPVYTSYLRPADYACIALIDLTAALLGTVIGSGIAAAVARYHFDAEADSERDAIWWTGITFVAGFAALIIGPLWLIRDQLAVRVFGADFSGAGGAYMGLALGQLWFSLLGSIPDSYFRVRKWSAGSVVLALGALLANIGVNVWLLSRGWGVQGILTGNFAVTAGATLVRLAVFGTSRPHYRFDPALIQRLWRFGAPLVVTGLLSTVIHQADRYLLRVFADMEQVGVYSLAYCIAQGVSTSILTALASIWSVAVYEIEKQPGAREIYTRFFKYFVYGLGLVLLALSLLARPILSLMAAPDYIGAADLVPVIALGYLLFSFHSHFAVPAMIAKRTASLIPAFTLAAITSLAANCALIPLFGSYGAAATMVITSAAFSFIGLVIYRQIDRYEYPFARVAAATCGMITTYVVYRALGAPSLILWQQCTLAALLLAIWGAVLFGPLCRNLLRQRRLTEGRVETALRPQQAV